MLQDFLRQCTCTQREETADFLAVCQALESHGTPTAYMPAVTWDLWPLCALSGANACTFTDIKRPAVYLVPIGAHEFWAESYFARLVLDFYREDICPETNHYGYDIEEMILLDYPDAGRLLDLQEFGSCSAVYLCLRHSTGAPAHMFLLMEDPSEGWNRIIRKYEIPVHVLIDSHKGLGDWYDAIPLCGYIAQTPPPLFPEFYFKGKYISHPAPDGCEFICDIPESDHSSCVSQLYRMRRNLT